MKEKNIKNLNLSELNELKNTTYEMMAYYDKNLSTYKEMNALEMSKMFEDDRYKDLLKRRNQHANFYKFLNNTIENILIEWEDTLLKS